MVEAVEGVAFGVKFRHDDVVGAPVLGVRPFSSLGARTPPVTRCGNRCQRMMGRQGGRGRRVAEHASHDYLVFRDRVVPAADLARDTRDV